MNWNIFRELAPTYEEVQKNTCIKKKTESECLSLDHCQFDADLKWCLPKKKDDTLTFMKTDEGVDCTTLDPENCMEFGCGISLPNSDQASCFNL